MVLRSIRHYVIGNHVYDSGRQQVRVLQARGDLIDEVVFQLVKEVVPNSCVLVFCPTKKDTETLAKKLAELLQELKTYKVHLSVDVTTVQCN